MGRMENVQKNVLKQWTKYRMSRKMSQKEGSEGIIHYEGSLKGGHWVINRNYLTDED